MAEDVLVFNTANQFVDTIEKFYDSPPSSQGGQGTRITKFSAPNDTTSSIDYKAYIFNSVGTVQKALIPQTTVVRDRVDLGASIVGHLIPPGGSLRMEASVAGGIEFYVTGNEL